MKTKRMVKPPKGDDPKPFIIEHERLNKPESREFLVDDPLSSNIPANQANLELAEEYRKALPKMLDKRIPAVRDFLLGILAPLSLGMTNGLADAQDVLSAALGEEVDVSPYTSRLEELMHVGLEVKMVSFVQDLLKLSPDESQRFLLKVFSKDLKNEDLASVVSKMLALADKSTPTRPAVKTTRRNIKLRKGNRV